MRHVELKRLPDTNKYGLVIPPTVDELHYVWLNRPRSRANTVDRHHLYWPETLYESTELSKHFRSHKFNTIWLLLSDHFEIHENKDGVPIPPEDVMLAYLDEAKILDELGVCVRAVEMINSAIYEGRVRRPSSTNEDRHQHFETIHANVRQIRSFEVMPVQHVDLVINQIGQLPVAA